MKRFFSKILLAFFLPLGASAEFSSIANQFHLFPNSRIEFGYNFGKYIGIDKNYSEVGAYIPAMLSEQILSFGDVRVFCLDNGKVAASGGVGFRNWVGNSGVIGTNFYYDYRKSKFKGDFHRVGIGLEWLSECGDFRLNGYIPVQKKSQRCFLIFNDYIGNYLVVCKRKEYCIHEGFDAEWGRSFASYKNLSFYGAIGPYFYHARHDKNFWGVHARLEMFWNSFLSFQIRTSYDSRYHGHMQGRLMLSFPLDAFCGCEPFEDVCAKLFTQPVKRNGLIFTKSSCKYTTNY